MRDSVGSSQKSAENVGIPKNFLSVQLLVLIMQWLGVRRGIISPQCVFRHVQPFHSDSRNRVISLSKESRHLTGHFTRVS